jgi:hypothetical protein
MERLVMAGWLKDRVVTVFRGLSHGASGLGSVWMRRDEDLSGNVTWELRDGRLGLAMIAAAVTGFGAASAMSGEWTPRPRATVPKAEIAPQPERLLKIQVRPAPETRVDSEAPLLPAPVFVGAPVASAPAPFVASAPSPAPVTVARAEPVALPVRPPPASVSAPFVAAEPAPVRVAARTVQVPIAANPGPRALQVQPSVDEDPAVVAADREMAAAYRQAQQAGVPAQALRADRQAWRTTDRAAAAERSRGALLNAYRDHIEDLLDAADDAAAGQQQQRYSQNPGGYQPAYQQPYPRY